MEEQSEAEQQRKWLGLLQEASHSPIYVTTNWLKGDKYAPGKRTIWQSHRGLIDHRSVASNEIVFEIDATYQTAKKYADKILDTLNSLGAKPLTFVSGGKGIHISLFFDTEKNLPKEVDDLLFEAMSYGFSYREVREWLWNRILDIAGVPENARGVGHGKPLDKSAINFDDLRGKNKLIRCCGGRKQDFDELTGETKTTYKCFMPELPKKKPNVMNFGNVEFPNRISQYKISKDDLCEMLGDYIKRQKESGIQDRKPVDIEGKYVDLPVVQQIREGLKRGSRAAGAKIIAIACANDNLSKEEAYAIMTEYVENCNQGGESFTREEAVAWVDWIYRQDKVFWNCGLTKEIGFTDHTDCEFCNAESQESIDLLCSSDLLKRIKEALDTLVVGEDHVKMLIFLLTLSKDFPNDPDWNIFGDPKTQAVILNCDSGSGKSYVPKQVLRLFPTDCVDTHSRITASALNYYSGRDMDGKVIMIEELQSIDESSNQLRLWISEGVLKLTSVEKRKNENGEEENVLIQKTTKGTPFFITGTAEDTVEHQLNTRMWMLSLDTSQDQNKRILSFQDRLGSGGIMVPHEKVRVIRDALASLKPYHFLNPFADHELLNIPFDQVRVRRDYEKFLTLMYCVAYLHQRQRLILSDRNNAEYIVCEMDDYLVARELAQTALRATFTGLSEQQISVLRHIAATMPDDEFVSSDIVEDLDMSLGTKVDSMLVHLCNNGFLLIKGQRGKSPVYALNKYKRISDLSLPDFKDEESLERLHDLLEARSSNLVSRGDFGVVANNSSFWKSTIEKMDENDPKSENSFRRSGRARILKTLEFWQEGMLDRSSQNDDRPLINKKRPNRLNTDEKPENIPLNKDPERRDTTDILQGGGRRSGAFKKVLEFAQQGVSIEDMKSQSDENCSAEEIEAAIKKLKEDGVVYEPRKGKLVIF